MRKKSVHLIRPTSIIGSLIPETQFRDTKDPCVLYDGQIWHIYGSGGDVRDEVWQILHATAPSIMGPWKEEKPVELIGLLGNHVAAPSVHYDSIDNNFHMIVQTEFTTMGGSVKYLQSSDGQTFTCVETILESIPNSSEAGIYDPHQAILLSKKYLVYAGTPAVEGFHGQYIIQPDVHLAESGTVSETSWEGPWIRRGIILNHEDIDWHHNQNRNEGYEWGIEGPQLIYLPNGKYLLNATCFLAEGAFGTRQRVFFALSDTITGPYTSTGPVIDPILYPELEWLSGENGHASIFVLENILYLFFQSRGKGNSNTNNMNWKYGIATFPLSLFD